MIAEAEAVAVDYLELIEKLPANGILTLSDVGWEEYEHLIQAVGEAPSLRISYDQGRMQIMTLSFKHEYYAHIIEHLIGRLSSILRRKVFFFGSATLKKQKRLKGAEPDACFYVQSAPIIGNKINLDLRVDPPPDVVLEVDIHHESFSRFHIYEGLGVPELWHYDEQTLTIYQLREGRYESVTTSIAFPMLTSAVLTEFLTRSQSEDQYETLLAFEEWLRAQRS
jgi:Uma2 family endonuclease